MSLLLKHLSTFIFYINLESIKTIPHKTENLPGPCAHGNVCTVAAVTLWGPCPVALRRHQAGKKPMAPRRCHVVCKGFLDGVGSVRCFEVFFFFFYRKVPFAFLLMLVGSNGETDDGSKRKYVG